MTALCPTCGADHARLHKLVADFQANGGSRELGDPTAGVWFEAAQQVLDALNTALCPTCGADHGGACCERWGQR